jgi:hypothetical protein
MNPRMPRGTVLALALGLTVASLAERPAFAQDGNGDPVLGKQVWLSGAPCRNCHGWAANGV